MGKGSKIGFSVILSKSIYIGNDSSVGHFNYIHNEGIILSDSSRIGTLNRLSGPFKLRIQSFGEIGNFNTFVKAPLSVQSIVSSIYIGKKSKITSRHYIDCMCNITIKSYTVIAGIRSQLWTHGYYHYAGVDKRVRIDGQIKIGRYCYIGSGSIFNPGIKICDSVNIGSHSVISKSISESGLYVNEPLRLVNYNNDFSSKLRKESPLNTKEEAYVKDL
ncbi:acyltransferase [Vibrio breoganii]|uniref:acyltransferase n=1 Tax=Vibrio breoganii TaxID=553239 RepID=UPI0012FFF6C6|nr:hypothetical protein [Vibrio breoganii]